MKDLIVNPYAPNLIESTRSLGHSFETALADIVDNSISKGAKEININFQSVDKPYVAVIDDACGMDENELVQAMRYGSKNPLDVRDVGDLGRFGLGLKVASLSQCRKLTVITKKSGKISAAKWDLDYIIKKREWVLICLDENDIKNLLFVDNLKKQKSGTVVFWEDFDRLESGSINPQKLFDEKIEIARSHIALVYHRFLGRINPLKIYFNGLRVETVDPFLTSNPATQPLPEQELIMEHSTIKVKPFVLPYISKLSSKDRKLIVDEDLRHSQGFYIYRNERLIIWGTWFKLITQFELNKLARVRVDIPNTLDSIWEIDVKKSAASLPNFIKQRLVGIVKNAVGVSESVYNYRGRNVTNDELVHVWNLVEDRGSYRYSVNRDIAIYKAIETVLDEKELNYLDSLIKTIEDTIPYSDIYNRKAKNDESMEPKELEFDEVYKIVANMIDSLKNNSGDVHSFIDDMEKFDFLMKYPDVIKAIRKEYKNE